LQLGVYFKLLLERFSNECCKTKTKVITQPITTNTNYPMNQSELEVNTCNRLQARENACEREQVVTDWFEFYSWLVEKVAQKVLTNHRAK